MNSFLAWIGGKRILAETIVSMMPVHKTYIEVFGGAGWVLFRKEQSKVEVWNDLNSDLVNLFRTVRNKLELFKSRQYYILASRDEYQEFQKALKTGKFKSDIDRAIAFYYCLRNSFGSGIFTGWGFGRTSRPRYCAGLEKLEDARERLKHVYIDNLSFDKLIPNWDSKEALFYCDPPYAMMLEKGGKTYYQCSFTEDDHIGLRDTLAGISGKFILSYDDHKMVRRLYKGYKIRRWTL